MSADQIDDGSETAEFLLQVALNNAGKYKFLPFVGRCYNCESRLSDSNFCDSDCRDDYEKRNKA